MIRPDTESAKLGRPPGGLWGDSGASRNHRFV